MGANGRPAAMALATFAPMSISVSGITKVYGQQKALDDVTFEIGGGEVVGFLGRTARGRAP